MCVFFVFLFFNASIIHGIRNGRHTYLLFCVLDNGFNASVPFSVAVESAGGAVSLRQQTVLAAPRGGLPGVSTDSGPQLKFHHLTARLDSRTHQAACPGPSA